MQITRFRCIDEADDDVPCDAFGDSVAYACPRCGSPLLATLLKGQRGSSAELPTECRCGLQTWITIDSTADKALRLRMQSAIVSNRLM